MNDLSPKRTDKFKAYRARKKAAGLKEVRLWVPDATAPGFRAKLEAQAKAMQESPEELEVLAFCEVAAAEVWGKAD